jgi:catechol 2,3-dioxygenase-like lactoylglutathione lyase family enzyme
MSGFSLGTTTLLLFQLGSTTSDVHTPTGVIPGHGPSETILSSLLSKNQDNSDAVQQTLKQHFCLAVKDPQDVAHWDTHLQKQGVRILGRMNWDRGGKSVYFEDPDGHVGEIGSRGIWAHY